MALLLVLLLAIALYFLVQELTLASAVVYWHSQSCYCCPGAAAGATDDAGGLLALLLALALYLLLYALLLPGAHHS